MESSVTVRKASLSRVLGVLWVLSSAWSAPAEAESMRCDGRLVQRGDRKVEVLRLCGEPRYRHRARDITAWYHGHRLSADELWFYDRGSNRLVYRLLFKGPELVLISTEGFGHPQRGEPRCEPNEIREGMSVYELLATCGEPVDRERWIERRPAYRDGDDRLPARPGPVVRMEEWTYDFGRNHFLRFVRLRDGRVHAVEFGDRGG